MMVAVTSFSVSGTVTGGTSPIAGVTITYTIDDVAQPAIVTSADGRYKITADIGKTVKITGVTSPYYDLTDPDPASLPLTFKSSATQDLVMTQTAFYVSGAVTAGSVPIVGATITYTIDGVPMTVTTGALGKFTLSAPLGKTIVITGITASGYVIVTAMPMGPYTNNTSGLVITMTDTVSITFSGKNVTSDAPSSATVGTTLSFTITASSGFTLPSSITVTMGGKTLVQGTDYTYDSATGAFSLTGVSGNVVVTAEGVSERSTMSWIVWTLSFFAGTLAILLIASVLLIAFRPRE